MDKSVSVWLDMLNAGHKLVIAGLAREVAPGGDTLAAYRSWYTEQMEEHDRVVERMLRPHATTSKYPCLLKSYWQRCKRF